MIPSTLTSCCGLFFAVMALCLLLAIRFMASKVKERDTTRAANFGILALIAFLTVSFII